MNESPSISDSLIAAIPDFVAFVRRDGVILHQLGGRQLPFVCSESRVANTPLDVALQGPAALLAARLLRRAFASRSPCEAQFAVGKPGGPTGQQHYEIRVSPQGRERALCVIRQATDGATTGSNRIDSSGIERRDFLRRLKESVSSAALRERSLALSLIHLGGVTEIGRLIDFSLADQITSHALARLPQPPTEPEPAGMGQPIRWYLGMVGEALLGVVFEGTSGRECVRAVVTSLCESLVQPVQVGDAKFHLKPCAGVAVLGEDASKASALLQSARAAMLEARRGTLGQVQFYSDTLRMLPVARLDVERELRRAINEGQITLRYLPRHSLTSGQVVALHAYPRWVHPLRGDVPPAEFLPIANATGLAVSLSRAAFECLRADAPQLLARYGEGLKLSVGTLRHQVISGPLVEDCRHTVGALGLARGQFELRIAERTLAAIPHPQQLFADLVALGASTVVEEVGRGHLALSRLAQLPIAALQIDPDLVIASASKDSAGRTCRAVAALCRALEVEAIAPAVDQAEVRARLLDCGFTQGLGELFGEAAQDTSAAQRVAR